MIEANSTFDEQDVDWTRVMSPQSWEILRAAPEVRTRFSISVIQHEYQPLTEIFAAISKGRGLLIKSTSFWRIWQFLVEISKTRIDRNIRCNLKGSGFPYVFDHFPRFLAGTEHFEQKSQKR